MHFSNENGGIGTIRKEANNARQWAHWGFDYLKYDWSPCDPYNAELMRKQLVATDRDFGFCVSVNAMVGYISYWRKYCSSYRNNVDSCDNWDNFMRIYASYRVPYITAMNKGHFFDLDMLDSGVCGQLDSVHPNRERLTEDEQLMAFSLRAFMGSPIQISCQLEYLDEFLMSMYCNEEVLAINQDTAFCSAKPCMVLEGGDRMVHVYRRRLADGGAAYAAFNLGRSKEDVTLYFDEACTLRDVWAKEDLGTAEQLTLSMHPHTVRIIRTGPVK